MNTPPVLNPRPEQVKYAAILLATSTGLAIVNLAFRAHSDNPLTYVVLAAIASVPLLFAWLIFRGKNWARWVFVVLTVLNLLFIPSSIRRLHASSAFQVWFYCFQTLLQVIIAVLLCLPSSNEWFKKRLPVA
jgi:hypothetical protein